MAAGGGVRGDRTRTFGVLVSYVRKYNAYTKELQQLTGDVSTRIEESVRGIRVIKALGRSQEEIQKYTAAVEELNSLDYRRSMLVALVAFYQRVIVGVSTLIALWVGVPQVASGEVSLGSLTAYFAVLTVVLGHVLRSTTLISSYLNYRVAMERHVEVMSENGHEEVVLTDEAAEQAPIPSGGVLSVTFDNVHFYLRPRTRAQLPRTQCRRTRHRCARTGRGARGAEF